MKRLIVKPNRQVHLTDITASDPFYFSASKKDVESGTEFEVPDNPFFRGKINEGLLAMVGEKQDEVVPEVIQEVQEKRRYKREK